jgi:D-alanine transfer protein
MSKTYPHLLSGLIALLIAGAGLVGGSQYAAHLESLYVNTLDLLKLKQVATGSAIQVAAFQRSDLLPVYGSSELINEDVPYSDYNFFQNYPTGFNVFQVARSGGTSIMNAMDLAGLGSAVRGKKVVISFTPSMFNHDKAPAGAYAGNFSRLHADALAFSVALKLNTKHLAAVRMLDYPDTLSNTPLLLFALQNLAVDQFYSQVLYYLSVPLGQIETAVIRLQDHWEILNYIWSNPQLQPDNVNHIPVKINWQAEITMAKKEQKVNTNSNRYGIENRRWLNGAMAVYANPKKPGSSDKQYLRNLNASKEWDDLQITLNILNDLGAKPLILSRPIDGAIANAIGISFRAREFSYYKLGQAVYPFNIPLVDFRNHDKDLYFSVDQLSHTSREGWVYVDQALDKFYHGVFQ